MSVRKIDHKFVGILKSSEEKIIIMQRRIIKCSVLADDMEDVEKLFSHWLFSRKIVNSYSCVGVISFETVVVQVQVLLRSVINKQSTIDTLSSASSSVFELDENIIQNLFQFLLSLDQKVIAI